MSDDWLGREETMDWGLEHQYDHDEHDPPEEDECTSY